MSLLGMSERYIEISPVTFEVMACRYPHLTLPIRSI